MRGQLAPQSSMFHYFSPESRVPADHPLRRVKRLLDCALGVISGELDALRWSVGRPSIPPERLLKAQLLIALHSIRSEHQFCEQLDYNILFRWFLDMDLECPTLDQSNFSCLRERLVRATIYFGDDSGIRSDYHTGTICAPQGRAQATGRRFSLNMISAVSAQGEFRFMLHEGSVGARVFVELLKSLMVNGEKSVFLIVHGHPIHKAKMVDSHIASLDGMLKLFYLSPCSPRLNPDETVWAHVRRKVSRQLVESADEMKRLALCALRSVQKLSEIVKSFFRQPERRCILT